MSYVEKCMYMAMELQFNLVTQTLYAVYYTLSIHQTVRQILIAIECNET